MEKYFQSSDDEEELERQKQEKLRLKKKQNYYKKLKEKEKILKDDLKIFYTAIQGFFLECSDINKANVKKNHEEC